MRASRRSSAQWLGCRRSSLPDVSNWKGREAWTNEAAEERPPSDRGHRPNHRGQEALAQARNVTADVVPPPSREAEGPMTARRGWPKRRSPDRLLRGRITRSRKKLADQHGMRFDDLFRKSDAWLLDQPWIGPLCVRTPLREMQGADYDDEVGPMIPHRHHRRGSDPGLCRLRARSRPGGSQRSGFASGRLLHKVAGTLQSLAASRPPSMLSSGDRETANAGRLREKGPGTLDER